MSIYTKVTETEIGSSRRELIYATHLADYRASAVSQLTNDQA